MQLLDIPALCSRDVH